MMKSFIYINYTLNESYFKLQKHVFCYEIVN